MNKIRMAGVAAALVLMAAGPEERARQLVAQMTQGEKLAMLHGSFAVIKTPGAIGSAGYVPGVARLGVPALQETDASLGITDPYNVRPGDTAVALPSTELTAATFNPDVAYQNGALLGRQAAARGFNVVLGGGANLARDPRGGRNFEYSGEDPLLAGIMVGAAIRGTQDQHVISTVKHFVLNDQESGRTLLSANIDYAALEESDLLAFKLAIEQGHPGALMCAYNRVNGGYACQNRNMLTTVLKFEWRYPGWVMSDWGAVHAVDALNAGLDQESGEQLDSQVFFGQALQDAVAAGKIDQAAVDGAVARIVRSMIDAGLLDHLKAPADDPQADLQVARRAAAEGMVLLQNNNGVLPLRHGLQRIAVIGGAADAGMLAGGGSSQVTPLGGYARSIDLGRNLNDTLFRTAVFDPPSPLSRLQAAMPGTRIMFADGRYPAQAANLARFTQMAIVFVHQWSAEASDIADLSLPDGQDALIERIAAANPNTVVVVENGGPVLMPWRNHVAAIVDAWYAGQGGADALADILTGAVDPSGHLPVSFPASTADLPRPDVVGMYMAPNQAFGVNYTEGAEVGYRWFARTGKPVLYPFGFGLSYTSFACSNLHLTGGKALRIEFDITNTGKVAGMDVPQAYLTDRAGVHMQRLLGFAKRLLQPGQTQHVAMTADARLFADFVPMAEQWRVPGGSYSVGVGADAADLAVRGTTAMDELGLAP